MFREPRPGALTPRVGLLLVFLAALHHAATPLRVRRLDEGSAGLFTPTSGPE